jgi:hypothetical protein
MNQDHENYITWLRSLLRNSNGVFIEWNENPKQSFTNTKNSLFEESRNNLNTMRKYVKQQIEYNDKAGMIMDNPIPTISFPLTPSKKALSWVFRESKNLSSISMENVRV